MIHAGTGIGAVVLGVVIAGCPGHALAGQPYEYVTEEVIAPGVTAGDWYGYSVAMGSGFLAVGAINDDGSGIDAGAVSVFNIATGAFLYELTPAGAGDRFGYDVAIDGNLLLVGAPFDQLAGVPRGSMYLFNLYTGGLIAKFNTPVSLQMGWSVAITENVAVGGAVSDVSFGVQTGAVYAYHTGFLTEIVRIFPLDGTPQASFGASTAITQDYLAVGAGRSNNGIGEAGAVYLYDFQDGSLLHKLIPDDTHVGQQFGTDVAIEGDLIVVGAQLDAEFGLNSGAVYLFDAVSGNQITKLLPNDPRELAFFGSSVAISDGLIAVGADNQQNAVGVRAGAVYLFDAETHEQLEKLTLAGGMLDDSFGDDVALAPGVVGVGALFRNARGVDSGAAYLLRQNCFPDIDGNGTLDFFDISLFLANGIDYNGDGSFDFFDVSAFLADFQEGCP